MMMMMMILVRLRIQWSTNVDCKKMIADGLFTVIAE